MSYTATGAHRRAARRKGILEDEYLRQIALGNRHCGRCGQWLLAATHFQKRSRGSPYWCGWCARCRAEHEAEKRQQRASSARPTVTAVYPHLAELIDWMDEDPSRWDDDPYAHATRWMRDRGDTVAYPPEMPTGEDDE